MEEQREELKRIKELHAENIERLQVEVSHLKLSVEVASESYLVKHFEISVSDYVKPIS